MLDRRPVQRPILGDKRRFALPFSRAATATPPRLRLVSTRA